MRRWAAGLLMVFVGGALAWPQTLEAQSTILQVCRHVTYRDLGASGSTLDPVQCGREFAVSDSHVVLFARVERLDYEQQATLEVLDPEAASVARGTLTLTPAPGIPTSFLLAFILALAGTRSELAARYPRLELIEVSGKPVRERTGEWTWQLALGRGRPSAMKFVLKP